MNIKTVFLSFAIYSIVLQNVNAQMFDSSFALLSSDYFDYKNPTFENIYGVGNSQFERFAFERHYGNSSDIIIRTYSYYTEDSGIVLVADGHKNINPSFSSDMIVWQSDKFGKQDLFYSVKVGGVWSSPLILDTSSSDKIYPNLHFSGYGDIYGLSYQKNNNIYFRHYRGGQWHQDTSFTLSISGECHNQVMWGHSAFPYNMSVIFVNEINDSVNRIIRQPILIDYPTYEIIYYPQEVIYSGKKIRNLRLSSGSWNEFVLYERDSSGNTDTDILGYALMPIHQTMCFTSGFIGMCYNGTGTNYSVVFENIPGYTSFFCFAFGNKNSDSSMINIYITRDTYDTLFRNFYLGDSSVSTNCRFSSPVLSNFLNFRFRLIWEQKIKGKMSLMESDMYGQITPLGVNSGQLLINDFELMQNYPNPFNPKTIINYQLRIINDVTLKVYDALGKEVAVLVNERQNAGSYKVEFDGRNLPSGVYFYKLVVGGTNSLSAGKFSDIKSMILLK